VPSGIRGEGELAFIVSDRGINTLGRAYSDSDLESPSCSKRDVTS
jgi:hypothetical protein